MIRALKKDDIERIATIHKEELLGFLPQLGIPFLKKFYHSTLSRGDMFTYVLESEGEIAGFVTGAITAKDLNKKIIFSDPIGYGLLFFKFFITNPKSIPKVFKTLTYPGFSEDIPELLTIAISNKRQKKGFGKKLFLKTAQEFKKRGIKKFEISVYNRLPAVGFYKKMGCIHLRTFDFLGEPMSYFAYNV